MKQKLFKLLGNNDEDVLGGAVEFENVYISLYPRLLKTDFRNKPQKRIQELEINEYSLVYISLSGTQGTYRIVRVQ